MEIFASFWLIFRREKRSAIGNNSLVGVIFLVVDASPGDGLSAGRSLSAHTAIFIINYNHLSAASEITIK